jgi:Peptidase M1 N-terminal domain
MEEAALMTAVLARTARVLMAAVLALWLAGGGAAAAGESGFDFVTTPGKLPKTVVPLHYAIELRPDRETLRLPGTETVEIEVREATDRLILNAVAMTIEEALLEGEAGQVATVALDAQAETATLTFPHAIGVGQHRRRLAFTGTINRFGGGLYYVDYPGEGGAKTRMLASHLEPADARRVFPAWDEPAWRLMHYRSERHEGDGVFCVRITPPVSNRSVPPFAKGGAGGFPL